LRAFLSNKKHAAQPLLFTTEQVYTEQIIRFRKCFW